MYTPTQNSMLKKTLTTIALTLFACVNTATATEEEDLTLEQVNVQIHGGDPLNPSPDSLVGKYLSETKAATIVRQFWTAPEGNLFPPRRRGPARLVIAVSPDSFKTFKKYFSSKHFLYMLNEHGNFAAFEGRMSDPKEPWHAEILAKNFEFLDHSNVGQTTAGKDPRIASPMILDSKEGDRARLFFELADHAPDYARKPWLLRTATGDHYSGTGAFSSGCGTWIGNMPIGNDLVDEYYFASADSDETNPIHPKLLPYKVPYDMKRKTEKMIEKVWKVPGHKQLGEILDPMANRRGDFDNAGWTSFAFIGRAPVERVPVLFYFVQDATQPIPADFKYMIDGFGAY